MALTKRLKKRSFRVCDVVRYEGRFGWVMDDLNGLKVRFPEPHDNSCYADVPFFANGTLLGDGPQVLFHYKGEDDVLSEYCRQLSMKVRKVNTRIGIGKPAEEDENGDYI